MTTIIIMGGFFVLLYFFMIRPQRRKMQAHQHLMADLEIGDDILTTGGIYGRIHSFDGDSLLIEVSDNNVLKITRSSIAQKIVYEEAPEVNNGNALPEQKSLPEAEEVEESSEEE